jgi:hypothetical protein
MNALEPMFVLDKVDDLFNHYVKQLNFKKELSVNSTVLVRMEADALETKFKSMGQTENKNYDEILKQSMYVHGWESAILGNFFIHGEPYNKSLLTIIEGMADCKFFMFLKDQLKLVEIRHLPEITKHYAEKWYGITHRILQAVGVEDQFINPSDKGAIMQFGISKYKLVSSGRGFYNGWKDFDLLNVPTEIKCFPKKDRNNWKDIILSIADNRAEVALWLKKQRD